MGMLEDYLTDSHAAFNERIITREQAKAHRVPLKRYFTGVPCKHGHVAERMTSDRSCLVCHAAKERARHARQRDACNAIKRACDARHRDERASQGREYQRRKRGEQR